MANPKRKVLFVCHNHPALYPGGAEAYALELYEGLRDSTSTTYEPVLLARTGSMPGTVRSPHRDTPFSSVNGDPNQTLFHADLANFDFFFLTAKQKDSISTHFRDFLLMHRPHVVHFQHTLFLGFDLLLTARRTLPQASIVYTLHEYLPICHHNGQMVQKKTNQPCMAASPRACSQCFPEIDPSRFFLRTRYIQSMLSMVDQFIAPSRFLMQRYIDWGIPAEKIRFEEYGRLNGASGKTINGADDSHPRRRFGFFGQLNPYKGADTLLEAMKLVASSGLGGDGNAPHLSLHGANLEIQPPEFQRKLGALIEETKQCVTYAGRYAPRDLPKLMSAVDWVIVPSIWWENSPLVIQEAFMHGRPVLCSDIGGMAEKVRDGVNGLHFRAGDASALAATIRRAATTPGLWSDLRRGIPAVYRMHDHIAMMESIYDSLVNREAAKSPAPAFAVEEDVSVE